MEWRQARARRARDAEDRRQQQRATERRSDGGWPMSRRAMHAFWCLFRLAAGPAAAGGIWARRAGRGKAAARLM